MTRNGKIARLPPAIRQQLNLRLQNGVPAQDLVAWLNQLPEVQAILAAHFAAKPTEMQFKAFRPNKASNMAGCHPLKEELAGGFPAFASSVFSVSPGSLWFQS